MVSSQNVSVTFRIQWLAVNVMFENYDPVNRNRTLLQ